METETTKTTDAKGRVALGHRFANKTVIIREIDPTEVVVTVARVIPEREAWLYENESAREIVTTGLRQAETGEFSDSPPDLDAASPLADAIEE